MEVHTSVPRYTTIPGWFLKLGPVELKCEVQKMRSVCRQLRYRIIPQFTVRVAHQGTSLVVRMRIKLGREVE